MHPTCGLRAQYPSTPWLNDSGRLRQLCAHPRTQLRTQLCTELRTQLRTKLSTLLFPGGANRVTGQVDQLVLNYCYESTSEPQKVGASNLRSIAAKHKRWKV
jgi:hypothetical protein